MKIGKIKELGQKIEQGAWVAKIPGMEDLALKVRARFNTDYNRRQKELFEAEPEENKPVNPITGQRELTDDAQARHDAILLHETVLVDWKNLEADESSPEKKVYQPYDLETAGDLLLDPKEPAFRNAVNYAAMVVADRGTLDIEAAAKN